MASHYRPTVGWRVQGAGPQSCRRALPSRMIEQRILLSQHQFDLVTHLGVGLFEQGGTFLDLHARTAL
jgi:hypothetical protein